MRLVKLLKQRFKSVLVENGSALRVMAAYMMNWPSCAGVSDSNRPPPEQQRKIIF